MHQIQTLHKTTNYNNIYYKPQMMPKTHKFLSKQCITIYDLMVKILIMAKIIHHFLLQ